MRNKPHILFVDAKWCYASPKYGVSSSMHSFRGPLEASSLATFDCFHFDQHYLNYKYPGDSALIRKCIETKPDLIFLIWIYLPNRELNPTIETLLTIRSRLNIPVFAWWGDTQATAILDFAKSISAYVDHMYVGDTMNIDSLSLTDNSNVSILPHSKDPRIFYDPGLERDINISFIGSQNHSDRKNRIEYLRSEGLEIFQDGGQLESKLSIEEYANYFMRSKISINFNEYENKPGIINGRIFEATLCGSLLVEPEWSGASQCLSPGIDYVTYSDYPDLVNKLRYYLEHDDERLAIAACGKAKAKERFSGTQFWQDVLKRRASISVPNCEKAFLNLAHIRAQSEYYTQALSLNYQALNRYPQSAQCYKTLGYILLKSENMSEAILAFERAISLSPNSIEVLSELGAIYCKRGDRQRGSEYFARALKIADDNRCSCADLAKLGTALLSSSFSEDSLKVLFRASKLEPNNQILKVQCAEALYYSGKIEDAEVVIAEVLKIDPFAERVNTHLSRFYSSIGKKDKALIHQWLSKRPKVEALDSLWQKIQLLELHGELELAQKIIDDHLAHHKTQELISLREHVGSRAFEDRV